jgi:hypothetical protein
MTIPEKVKRVFIHELGHFVAGEINCKKYNGFGTSGIFIRPCEENRDEFCGGAEPVKPGNYDENKKSAPPLDRLSEHLASLSYGCIFQSYFEKTELDDCLNKNGISDLHAWSGLFSYHRIPFAAQQISEIERSHYCKLVKNGSLNGFIALDPSGYLVSEVRDHYVVDIKKMRLETANLIEEHVSEYCQFVKRIKEAILGNLSQ